MSTIFTLEVFGKLCATLINLDGRGQFLGQTLDKTLVKCVRVEGRVHHISIGKNLVWTCFLGAF